MARINKVSYNIRGKVNKKIVLISDLHYYSKNDLTKLNKVLEQIKLINPDFICIPGDFIDEAKVYDMDLFVEYLKRLTRVSKVIMSIGNHDVIAHENGNHSYEVNTNFFNNIKKIRNLYFLDNEVKEIDGVCFIGINLEFDYYYNSVTNKEDFMEYFNKIQNIDSKKYNVLLCHSPVTVTEDEIVKKLKNKINLVLCGHMHGGLTPIWLQKILKDRVLINPSKNKLFVKNSYGYLRHRNINFVITSGITKLSHLSRLSKFDKLFSPEIVIINLTK